MSGIQLSDQLVTDLKSVMEKHDPSTDDDLMFLQYLSAVSGYVLAHQTQPDMDIQGLMSNLATFTAQVHDQVAQDMAPQPSHEEAFGIWKPESHK